MLTISVNVSLNHADADGKESVLMVECSSISKVKELEYMIESYSELGGKERTPVAA